MGSKLQRALLILLTVILCLGAGAAQAETASGNGIEVTLTTDRTEYEAGDKIQVTLEISNTSEQDIAPVKVQYSIPNMCTMDGDSSIVEEIDVLKSGETTTIETTMTVIEPPTAAEAPSTGDHTNIFLWIALAGVSLFGLSRMGAQNLKRLFAIVLCVSMMGSMLPSGVRSAYAQEEDDSDRGEVQDIIIPEDPAKVAPYILSALELDQQSEETAAEISESEAGTLEMEIDGLNATVKVDPEVRRAAAEARRAAAGPDEYEDPAGITVKYTSIDWENASEPMKVTAGTKEETEEQDKDGKDSAEDADDSSVHGTIVVSEAVAIEGKEKKITASVSYGSEGEQSSASNYSLSWYLNKNLQTTLTSNSVIKYDKVIKKAGTSLPKSSHPYKSNTDHIYAMGFADNIAGVTLIFNDNTRFENNRDALLLYDENLDYLDHLTGYTGGVSYTIYNQEGIALRLITDYSVNYYGFQCSGIVHEMPKITACKMINAYGDVKLQWKKLKGYTGYVIERAEVGPGGTYSAEDFVPLVAYANSKATSFTDSSTVPGKRYAYRMAQLYPDVDGKYYAGVYSMCSELTIPGYKPAPTILSAVSPGKSKVTLQWTPVDGTDGYAVYKAADPYKTFKLAAQVTDPFATISAAKSGKLSYYLVRPYMKNGKYYAMGGISDVMPNFALDTPSKFYIDYVDSSNLLVSWKKVSNAETYEVYISDNEHDGYRYLGGIYASAGSKAKIPLADIRKVFPSSPEIWVRVAAARTDYTLGKTWESISKLSDPIGLIYNSSDPIEVRSLNVFETNVPGGTKIPTKDRDVAMFRKMLSKATPSGGSVESIAVRENLTKAQLVSEINTIAAKTDNNDVTFFTLSCHGASHIVNDSAAGRLLLNNSQMTFGELATALNKIKGRVVIILTSCGSGSSIDKSAGENAQEESFDGDAFMNEFIEAIKEVDSEITFMEPAEEGDELAADGELKKANKFYVITAARGGENGIYATWNYGSFGYTYLFQWLYNGVVGKLTDKDLYDVNNLNKKSIKGKMPADQNKDGDLTLGEMQVHLSTISAKNLFDMDGDGRDEYQMRPQVYPDNSDFVLFRMP